jgi:hypothetical protein
MLADTLNKMSQLSADLDIAEVASLATESLVARAVEGIDGGAPGLVLSAEQLVNFRKYELAALALPTSLTEVVGYLGYETGGGGGLEATDFLNTFNMIHGHALQWNPLNREISLVATTLEIFGKKMAVWNQACQQLLDDVKIACVNTPDEAPKTFAELKTSGYNFKLDAYPELQVEAACARDTSKELSTLIQELFDEVNKKVMEATALEQQIKHYADELNNKIQPAISIKKKLILKKQESNELAPLVNKIEQRALEIKRLDVAYQAGVKSALMETFAGFGPLAGIYLGIKADGLRQDRNRLMRLQESDLIVLQAARTVESALVTVLYRLQQLELLIADARISIEHLNFMWSSIVSYAKSSSEATQTITDTISLLTFERRFKFVSAPWEHVVKNSKQLLNIFDEAEKIIAADYPK